LENNKDNYNAFVFEGAAHVGLQQSDQALGSYRRAAQLDAVQPLAWQVNLFYTADSIAYHWIILFLQILPSALLITIKKITVGTSTMVPFVGSNADLGTICVL